MTKWAVPDEQIQQAWTEWAGPKRGAVRSIAGQLGVPRDWLSRRLTALGLAVPHKKEPNWTPAEDALLASLPLYNPPRAARMMREHGYPRTATAIVLRAKRLEIDRRATHDTLSANAAAQLLGLDGKTVGLYCETGLITAERMEDERTAQQGGHRWCIAPDALRTFIRTNINSIDLRRVDKLSFFSLVDQVTVAPAAMPQRDPVKGWTPEKRKKAYRRFGEIIIQVADELNVPANELLAYALKGEVPPQGRDQGFEDTKVPGQLALPAPAPAPKKAPQARSAKKAARPRVKAEPKQSGPKGPSIWTAEREAELRRLAGTMKRADLADAMGLSDAAVAKAGAHFNVSLKHTPADSWTDERVAELRRLAEVERLPGPELAKRLGVKPSSLAGACHRYGIKRYRVVGTKASPPQQRPIAERIVTSRPAATPMRKVAPAPVRHNPRATTIAPTVSANNWVRLQHPDGRWLSMDGLSWVKEKAYSFHIRATQLAAASKAFPLVAECVVVPVEAWKPRDIAFSGAVR